MHILSFTLLFAAVLSLSLSEWGIQLSKYKYPSSKGDSYG